MQIYISDQYTYFIKSLIFGIILGVIYNILSALPLIFKKRNAYSFLTDFVFCVITSLGSIVLSFDGNGGIYRWYAFVGTGIGFLIYRLTLGKAVFKLEEIIIRGTKKIIKALFKKIYIVLDFFVKFVKMNIQSYRSKIYFKRFKRSIQNGFK